MIKHEIRKRERECAERQRTFKIDTSFLSLLLSAMQFLSIYILSTGPNDNGDPEALQSPGGALRR